VCVLAQYGCHRIIQGILSGVSLSFAHSLQSTQPGQSRCVDRGPPDQDPIMASPISRPLSPIENLWNVVKRKMEEQNQAA